MKILALDIGDRWTGSALSDPLCILAHPYKTIPTKNLKEFINQTITQKSINTVVVGYPQTLRGTESEQTRKVKKVAADLEQTFPKINWILWDERFSSQQAEKLKKPKTKAEKEKLHSIAAAFILKGYIEYLHFQKKPSQSPYQ